jgi:DNA polymerase IV
MERKILYLKVPSFPVAVERLRDPSLRGFPLAVCGAGPGPNPLQTVSREARREGLCRGMPRQQALSLCPGLRLLPPDPALYQRTADSLFRLLSGHSPLVEPARPGSLFLDLSGTRRLFGPARDLAWKIRREIRGRLELTVCLGMATNKLMSRIAVKAAPAEGLCDVFPGGEQPFLEPLAISVLPAARPLWTAEQLRELNIERVKHLVPVPMPALRLAFGRTGLSLFRQARGLDASPVRTPSRAPRVTEEETLTEESNEDTVILLALRGLAEEAGNRLRSMQADTGRVEVEIQYADGIQARRTARIRPAAHRDLALFLAARELLEQAAQRRVRLRRITLHCLDLRVGSGQGELFPAAEFLPPAELRREALQQAVDGIRQRFGKEAVRWAGPPARNTRAGGKPGPFSLPRNT